MDKRMIPWAEELPTDAFISEAPTYRVGAYFDLFEEGFFDAGEPECGISMKYYFYDPTNHGYPKTGSYPLLVFLHGASNALVGMTCINYTGAEYFASPEYQADLGGAYLLIPLANEHLNENNELCGCWNKEYAQSLKSLTEVFCSAHTPQTGKRFLFGSSAGGRMTFTLSKLYPELFDVIIPVGSSEIPEDYVIDRLEECGVTLFLAIGKHDEFNDFTKYVEPRLDKLKAMKNSCIFTPEWVRNGDGGIASINGGGREMGQHCLVNAMQANLRFDDGTPMDERFPRGFTGWIDEINRGGTCREREYPEHGDVLRTGHVEVEEGISLYYEEYGSGDNIILSAQAGFYHRGMQQRMARLGYHVYCITLRGFHPSTLITQDYKERWYDVFAEDVLRFADKMNIGRFTYMGASHGAGTGWHLMLLNSGRVEAFIAVVAGPHSLKEGTMSYRQMLAQGLIKCIPPFNPEIDNDEARQKRRDYRNLWMAGLPTAFEAERKLDYGRPMMRLGTEEKLCEALKSITVPTLLIGGCEDPISTPELMIRTAGCLPHCKLVMYSNCGHDIDTDLIEEVSDEADRFLRNVKKTGRCYLPVE